VLATRDDEGLPEGGGWEHPPLVPPGKDKTGKKSGKGDGDAGAVGWGAGAADGPLFQFEARGLEPDKGYRFHIQVCAAFTTRPPSSGTPLFWAGGTGCGPPGGEWTRPWAVVPRRWRPYGQWPFFCLVRPAPVAPGSHADCPCDGRL
jgi:hypothetical protein